jgi:hypothetical protein
MMLVALALMGLMVLAVTVSPPDPRVNRGASSTPAPSPLTPRLSDPDAFDVSATVSADPGSKQQTIEAVLGDRVEIVVEGREADSVALGTCAWSRSTRACRPASNCWRKRREPTRWSSSTRTGG